MTCRATLRAAGALSPMSANAAGESTRDIYSVKSVYDGPNLARVWGYVSRITGGAVGPDEFLFEVSVPTTAATSGSTVGLAVGPGDPADSLYVFLYDGFVEAGDLVQLSLSGTVLSDAVFPDTETGAKTLTYNSATDRVITAHTTSASSGTDLQINIFDADLNLQDVITFPDHPLAIEHALVTRDGYLWVPVRVIGDGFGFIRMDTLTSEYEIFMVPPELTPATSPSMTSVGLDCTGLGIDFTLTEGT